MLKRSRRDGKNRWWKEYMEEQFKKDLNEPDNYDGVVCQPESDILEGEVKWALGSTAVNKASGCDGIPVELFKTLKDDAIKVLHLICQQTWKTRGLIGKTGNIKRTFHPMMGTIEMVET